MIILIVLVLVAGLQVGLKQSTAKNLESSSVQEHSANKVVKNVSEDEFDEDWDTEEEDTRATDGFDDDFDDEEAESSGQTEDGWEILEPEYVQEDTPVPEEDFDIEESGDMYQEGEEDVDEDGIPASDFYPINTED